MPLKVNREEDGDLERCCGKSAGTLAVVLSLDSNANVDRISRPLIGQSACCRRRQKY